MSSTLKTDKGHIDYRRRLCHPAWSQEEIEAIEELAKIKDMPLAMVVRQAVRSYQLAAANQPNPVQ